MAKQKMATTPMMAKAGLSFDSLIEYAKKTVHLLQTTGDTFIDLAEQGFKLWQAVSGRDLSGILTAFASGQRDTNVIIAAIKTEFELE